MTNSRSRWMMAAVVAWGVGLAAAQAVPLTSASLDSSSGAYVVSEIVVDGSTYTFFAGASSVERADDGGNSRFYKVTGDPFDLSTATKEETLLGSNGLTVRGFSGARWIDLLFDTPINDGDDAGFFVLEHDASKDTVAFAPLDENGDKISDWSTGELATADWTTATGTLPYDSYPDDAVPDGPLGGIALTLTDFSGGTGTLTGVYGLRMFDGDSGVDPAVMGQYRIPEPATSSLLLGCAALLALKRRLMA